VFSVFEFSTISNLNVSDPMKLKMIQFSQNFGTVNFEHLTLDNFAVQFCIHQTATHVGRTRFNAIH